jgi:hypothetical protein
MTTYFFTLFDRNYAARGLVMLDSLRKHSASKSKTVVLALDDDAYRVAQGHADEVLRVDDLKDAKYLEIRTTRSHPEFCWTSAAVLADYMVNRGKAGDLAVYLDADLYFFTDPAVLLAEMGSDKNIMIHPHRFSLDRADWEKTAGIFNVGLVAFRVSEEAKRCTARWRQQVVELCVKDPERGLCGDQGYLNEWPALYPGLQIMQNIGGGVAPWNLASYQVGGSPSRPTIDGVPIVFFHFHQISIIDCRADRFLGAFCATGYDFSLEIGRLIYQRYFEKLKRQSLRLQRLGIPLISDDAYDVLEFRHCIKEKRILIIRENLWAWIRFALIIGEDNLANERMKFSLRMQRLKRLLGFT